MKKIITIILLALILVGGYMGFNYWNDTYNGKTAYALVPETVPEKEQTKDMDGKVQQGLYSYNYELKFVKENGDIQTMEYSVSGENPEPLTPNAYIKAEISKNRVISGPNTISENDVPDNAKKVLQD